MTRSNNIFARWLYLTLRLFVAVLLSVTVIIIFRHYAFHVVWPDLSVQKTVIGVLGTILLSAFAAGLLQFGARLDESRKD